MITIYIVLILISLILLLWQASNLISVFFGAPHVKTKESIISSALKLVDLKKDEIFYELGSGSGDVLISAAKFNVNAIGFEISPHYYLYSKFRTLRYKNIDIKFKNILDVDLSKADVIYCYLLPNLLKKLAPKFKKELKKSCRVISIGFPIDSLKLIKKIRINNHTIFIYKM